MTSNYPSNARELPRYTSPLVGQFVAPGHRYDNHTGLVKPSGPVASNPPASSTTTSTCLPGVGERETICADGVKVTPRPVDPFNPAGRRS